MPLVARWLREVVWLLEFEPTWFPEFGFAVGAIGWGIGGLWTDDLIVRGWAHALPISAIMLGLIRCGALMRLWYAVRVVLTAGSALLWAWLWCSMCGRFGVVPMMGPLLGCFLIEMLIAAKFSIACAREMRDEFRARRHAR